MIYFLELRIVTLQAFYFFYHCSWYLFTAGTVRVWVSLGWRNALNGQPIVRWSHKEMACCNVSHSLSFFFIALVKLSCFISVQTYSCFCCSFWQKKKCFHQTISISSISRRKNVVFDHGWQDEQKLKRRRPGLMQWWKIILEEVWKVYSISEMMLLWYHYDDITWCCLPVLDFTWCQGFSRTDALVIWTMCPHMYWIFGCHVLYAQQLR